MTAEIKPFTGVTSMDIPTDRVLQAAITHGMSEVVVCGFDAEGQAYFASSIADAAPVLYHLDRARWRLMKAMDEIEGDA